MKGVQFSMEGIRKGYLFCEKWYIKGKDLELGAEPPRIKHYPLSSLRSPIFFTLFPTKEPGPRLEIASLYPAFRRSVAKTRADVISHICSGQLELALPVALAKIQPGGLFDPFPTSPWAASLYFGLSDDVRCFTRLFPKPMGSVHVNAVDILTVDTAVILELTRS